MSRHRAVPEPRTSRKGRFGVLRWGTVVLALTLTATVPAAAPGDLVPVRALPQAPPPADLALPFTVFSEVYGDGGELLGSRLSAGLANGASLHPPVEAGEAAVAARPDVPLLYFAVPGSAQVERCYPQSVDPDVDATLSRLGRPASEVLRLAMPEFDQSGGCWSEGRPSVAGMSGTDAYRVWTDYYLETKGLRPLLAATDRPYRWATLCGYAFCPQYAYDLGAEVVLLERNNDEVSGLTPGLAMVRGAAAQHGDRPWGVDFSTYRYWNGGPTEFDDTGRLVTGWSPSTFERHMFASFMAGADLFHNEAVAYESGTSPDGLNPLGRVVRDFHDFALRRHADRGTPHVPVAVVQDHHSGFEPRFGAFDQARQKWYRLNPYTEGDTTLDALLEVAYPGHATWGTIVEGAPWYVEGADGLVDVAASQAAYREALAGGADPRPWEVMGSTRWGESLDVLTDRAGLDVLDRYGLVVLATSGPPPPALRRDLAAYVDAGGQVLLNPRQWSDEWADLAGLRMTGARDVSESVTWGVDGPEQPEDQYVFSVAEPAGAEVLATTESGAPLVTRMASASGGAVLVVTAEGLHDRAGTLLDSSTRLLDDLQDRLSPVRVQGAPVQYLVNVLAGRTVVTVVNTDPRGREWAGEIVFRGAPDASGVAEWTTDAAVPARAVPGGVAIDAVVPAYGVRVFSAPAS